MVNQDEKLSKSLKKIFQSTIATKDLKTALKSEQEKELTKKISCN